MPQPLLWLLIFASIGIVWSFFFGPIHISY
jgi:hypothetical protein